MQGKCIKTGLDVILPNGTIHRADLYYAGDSRFYARLNCQPYLETTELDQYHLFLTCGNFSATDSKHILQIDFHTQDMRLSPALSSFLKKWEPQITGMLW